MWALVYTMLLLGTEKPEVYGIEVFPTYIECFKKVQMYTPQLNPHQSLNCVMINED